MVAKVAPIQATAAENQPAEAPSQTSEAHSTPLADGACHPAQDQPSRAPPQTEPEIVTDATDNAPQNQPTEASPPAEPDYDPLPSIDDPEWKKKGFSSEAEFKKLDVSTWDAEFAKLRATEIGFADPDSLEAYLKSGNVLTPYTLQTTKEERAAFRVQLVAGGLSETDATKLDRDCCVMTVQKCKRGKPEAFADAFEPPEVHPTLQASMSSHS